MTFLMPSAWMLGALAVPIILFYLLKTRRRRRPVSTLLFWEQMEPRIENSPLWRKLRKWISLALQLLILGLLIAALARPAFEWEKLEPQRTVIILDPSASMTAQDLEPSRWHAAVDSLRERIQRLRVHDEMAILTAENPPRILSGWTSSRRALNSAVHSARLLPTGSDPAAAMDLAAQLSALRNNVNIEVLSDGVWPVSIRNTGTLELHAKPDAFNAGLSLFAVRRSLMVPGEWELDAEVVASGTTEFEGILNLRQDGEPMDQISVRVPPGETWRKTWRGNLRRKTIFEAVLSGTDALAADNTATVELPEMRELTILVAGPSDPFLEAALESAPLVNWFREATLPAEIPAGVDLVICTGSEFPNEPYPAAACLLIHPIKDGFWGRRQGESAEVPVLEVQKTGPEMRHTGFERILLDEAPRWVPADGSDVYAGAPGFPLLFGRWDTAPRWMVLGFDPQKSDVYLRTAFPVLLGNLIHQLRKGADAEGRTRATLPGAVESRLAPAESAMEQLDSRRGPRPRASVLPGWWMVLAAGLAVLLLEACLYHRRITD
jgi:hypothetical protein